MSIVARKGSCRIMVVGEVKATPSLRSLVGLGGRSTTLEMKSGKDFFKAAVRNFGQCTKV